MSSTDDRHGAGAHNDDFEDLAPGEEGHEEGALAEGVRGYVLGFLLAAGLTFASFYVAAEHVVWAPAVPAALVTLAVAQMGIHLVFFLHITTGPDNTNNVLALAFGILAVALVLGGSVWIMHHLNQQMPMAPAMAGPVSAQASMQP
jgi:cytochrome o ubiquinol oxidase operon protein cyoD